MNQSGNKSDRWDHVVILADESAHWNIGGLRQLDRLARSIEEFNESRPRGSEVETFVFWKPSVPAERRWFPNGTKGWTSADSISAVVLTTGVLLDRGGFNDFASVMPAMAVDATGTEEAELWRKLSIDFDCRPIHAPTDDRCKWRLISGANRIRQEQWLIGCGGKTDDGLVARYLNRPISRSVTRWLLKTSISPNAWSVGIMIFPIIGCWLLLAGSYWSVVLALLLFHLHSVLDGCDGEIARAKHLESEQGRQLDAFCDLGSTILLIACLGIGLYRVSPAGSGEGMFYLFEGLVGALVVGTTWILTHARKTSFGHLSRSALSSAKSAGVSGVSGVKALLIEVTKRDVAQFFFLILALLGLSSWVLHILVGYALISLALTAVALTLLDRSSAVPEMPKA